MKRVQVMAVCFVLAGTGFDGLTSRPGQARPIAPAESEKPFVSRAAFEENIGQTVAPVRFLSRGSRHVLYLTSNEAVLVTRPGLRKASALDRAKREAGMESRDVRAASRARDVVRLRFRDPAPAPVLTGEQRAASVSNYLREGTQAARRVTAAHFGKVRYSGLYPGIDAVFYTHGATLEYDFIVEPGADPARIRFDLDGAVDASLSATGDLAARFGESGILLRRPVAYQMDGIRRRGVPARFVPGADGSIGIGLGSYDATKPLIVDPAVVFSTYLGGADEDAAVGVAVDPAGAVYVVGDTMSLNFPTRNPIQGQFGGAGDFAGDIFVAKMNPADSALVYATYLGGSGDERAAGIAVDSTGAAYVTGDTESTNYPVTAGAFQSAYNGGSYDGFVTKLAPSGSTLVYSTFLGGDTNDFGRAIAVDGAGNAYIAGDTFSTDFPVLNPAQATFGGRIFDAFVTKLNPAGSALVYSTYLGGGSWDVATGIAIDSTGAAYVAGFTFATNFPVVQPLQATKSSGCDVFVTKVSPAGSSFVYSTYLGGNDDDYGEAIAVDGAGNCYVTGMTLSSTFPVRSAFQSSNRGGQSDGFVTRLNASGSEIVFSTYLGGSSYDNVFGVTIGPDGSVFISGATESANFPVAAPVQASYRGGDGAFLTRPTGITGTGFGIISYTVEPDAFTARFNQSGSSLEFSTYLGGTKDEFAMAIAVGADGMTYLAGDTSSAGYPVQDPIQDALAGDLDSFVTAIDNSGPDFSVVAMPATVTLAPKAKMQVTVAIDRTGGHDDRITGTPAVPAGINVKVKPGTASTTGGSLTFTIKTKKTAVLGTHEIVFTCRDEAGRERTATLMLEVVASRGT